MKLLACDYDGTLYDYEGHVKEEDVKAIVQFQKEGNLFGMCTGRPIQFLKPFIDERIQPDFYICISGSCIYDKDGNPLLYKTYDAHIGQQLYEMYKEYPMLFYGKDTCYSYHLDFENDIFQPLNSFDDFHQEELENFTILFSTIEETMEQYKLLKDTFDSVTFMPNGIVIDVISQGCSKKTGLNFIQNIFHLKDEDMFAIGDGMNDIPMFEGCMHSFTFHNVDETVKKHARYHVNSISEAIERIKEL